jgi:hypothetical protein
MTSLPPNVDAMIWKLAESEDIAAHADFVSQYPELKDELSRRVALVNRLRNYPHVQSRLPRFNPSPEPVSVTPKWVWPVAALVVMSGLAFAVTAGVTYFRSTQAPDPAPVTRPESHPVGMKHWSQSQSAGNWPVNASTAPPQNSASEGTRWDTPITMEAKGATLSAVVLAVASGAHVTIKVSEGVPNPTIDLNVTRQRAGSVLEDLGRKYGFGVLYETDKYAVLIPLAPENRTPNELPTMSVQSDPTPKPRLEKKSSSPPSLPPAPKIQGN